MSTSARPSMRGGRLSLGLRSLTDILAAILLLLAFAVAGWKVWSRSPAAPFASGMQVLVPPHMAPAVASVIPLAMPPAKERSPDGRFLFDAQFVSAMPGQAVHAASMVELRDSRLRAVWFSGSREGAGDVTIQTALMDAANQHWEPERTLFNRQQLERGLWRYVKKLGNPVIARAPDGSLFLWMVNVSLGGWAGSAITWSRSVDEGVSWSQPRRLVTSPFLNISTLVKGAPVALADGQLVLPVYHEFVTKFGEVLRINPQGQVVDKIRIPGSQTSLQPVMLVAGPERAQVYMRAGQGGKLMAAGTDDAGLSWSRARATAWPNPDSALAGVVSHTGRQWLALNPTSAGRETLAVLRANVAGSLDGVSSWIVEGSGTAQTGLPLPVSDYERLLGKELKARGASEAQTQAYVASARRQLCGAQTCSQEFSYPYLLQTSDGYIHLLYTWHRTRIKHVRFDPLQAALTASPAVNHVSPAN
ncbi:BNR repeat-like domain protein [compost metagenome]